MSRLTAKIMRFFALAKITPAPGAVLVACSGGPDSVALAQALFEIGCLGGLAHVNYQLREEAAEEANLVRNLAATWKVPFEQHVVALDHFDQPGLNLQAEARRIRYAFFAELMELPRWQFCATGHQEDDQVETLLFSLLRSLDGPPKGIPGIRGNYIRPLLACRRQEIIDFLSGRGITFATDSSNLSLAYDRNFLRHELLPRLELAFPGFRSRLLLLHSKRDELLALLKPYFSKIESTCIKGEPGDWSIDLVALNEYWSVATGSLFLEQWLGALGLNRREVRDVLALQTAQAGKMVLANNLKIIRNPVGFHIRSLELHRSDRKASIFKVPRDRIPFLESMLPFQVSVELLPLSKVLAFPAPAGVHWLDMEQVHWPLTIRRWEAGDRIQLLGMSGRQKLSDLFVNAGLDRFQKQEAVVVTDELGVVLVSGLRIADRVKIKNKTGSILEIKFERS